MDRLPPLRFLVIDDMDNPRKSAEMLLNAIGNEVVAEASAEAGLSRFEASPSEIDVILSDFNLPGLSGIEASGRFSSIAESAGIAPRPFFVLSGNTVDLQPRLEELKEKGINVFFKPARLADFRQMDAMARQLIVGA